MKKQTILAWVAGGFLSYRFLAGLEKHNPREYRKTVRSAMTRMVRVTGYLSEITGNLNHSAKNLCGLYETMTGRKCGYE